MTTTHKEALQWAIIAVDMAALALLALSLQLKDGLPV